MLSEVERREEALGVTQEAIELYRQLAAAHPAAFLPKQIRMPRAVSIVDCGARDQPAQRSEPGARRGRLCVRRRPARSDGGRTAMMGAHSRMNISVLFDSVVRIRIEPLIDTP